MERNELRKMSDETMNELIQQLMNERERRRKACLSQYRNELIQMWQAIVTKVKELDEMDIDVNVNVEKEGGDLYFSLTNLVQEECFAANIYTSAQYKSKS